VHLGVTGAARGVSKPASEIRRGHIQLVECRIEAHQVAESSGAITELCSTVSAAHTTVTLPRGRMSHCLAYLWSLVRILRQRCGGGSSGCLPLSDTFDSSKKG
jgi:hypothetical protein